MSDADDRFAIIAVLDRYAEVLDTRDWPGLADVFTDDVDMDFGVWHADLYRLSHPEEVFELGLDSALTDAIVMIEWPDRLGMALPEAVSITLSMKDAGRNCVIASASDRWKSVIDQILDATHA